METILKIIQIKYKLKLNTLRGSDKCVLELIIFPGLAASQSWDHIYHHRQKHTLQISLFIIITNKYKNRIDLDEQLEVDIIGFRFCSFGVFALTPSFEIDPLHIKFKFNQTKTKYRDEKIEKHISEQIDIKIRSITIVVQGSGGAHCYFNCSRECSYLKAERGNKSWCLGFMMYGYGLLTFVLDWVITVRDLLFPPCCLLARPTKFSKIPLVRII